MEWEQKRTRATTRAHCVHTDAPQGPKPGTPRPRDKTQSVESLRASEEKGRENDKEVKGEEAKRKIVNKEKKERAREAKRKKANKER